MKYILSFILLFVSVVSLADDNITLYYEANGQCPGLYSVAPTSGCYTGGVQVSNVVNQGANSGYYVDGVQIIDANGNVNPDAANILAGNGTANQTAVTDSETDQIYGPWNIYFYGGENYPAPLEVHKYKRNPNWNEGSGNASYIGLFKTYTGIKNGSVEAWCEDPNLINSCWSDAGDCVSGCVGRVRITIPWNASGDKSFYAKLKCDRGYHAENYKCVKDQTAQSGQQISESECRVTNGIWDGANCKYRIYWNGPGCSDISQHDTYYIGGRDNNFVHCRINKYTYPMFVGWCLDPSKNSTCSNDTSGSMQIPANARGEIVFYALEVCPRGTTYNSSTGRCSSTPSDATFDPICTNSTLWGCNTETSCSTHNGVWDVDNSMCASRSFVASNNNSIWPTHDCNIDNTCVGATQTEQEICNNNGGVWFDAEAKCEYSITWVYNIDGAGDKPSCDSRYFAGQETTITCLPTRTASVFQSWCADNTLRSSCTMASDGTIKIPATARGPQIFYAKWKCRKGTSVLSGNNQCYSVSSSNPDYHCAQYPNSAGCETVLTYNCEAGTDLSGCRSESACSGANGKWDSLNGMCAWNPKLENSSSLRTIKYYCNKNTYKQGTIATTVSNIRPDEWFDLEDVSDYCSIPGDTPNFVGWRAQYASPIGAYWPTTTWDNKSFIQFPIANANFLNMIGQWRAGNNGSCPENVARYQLRLADYEIDGAPQRNGKFKNCLISGCGKDWYNANISNLANCEMTWDDSYHRQFTGWCKDAEWNQCDGSLTFGPVYYAKYSCTDGYKMDGFKLCRCQGTIKPITYIYDQNEVDSLTGGIGSPMRHKCWNYQCDDEVILSSWCRPRYAGQTHKVFAGWCRNAARTDCPVTGDPLLDTFHLEGNNTYYDSWKCADGYVKSGNSCVPE